jgi:XTP/dITP diphosphohydrolase
VKIVIATSNSHKIHEIADKMTGLPDFTFLPMKDACAPMEIEETGATFMENALIKARAVLSASGLPSLADDSGLAVDALGGEPGIFSARYGNLPDDKSRYMKVLSQLENIPEEKRTARFVCAMALALPDGREFTAEGVCEGSIAREPRGSCGFGYDPVFIVKGGTLSMAEISLVEKNRLSHRALALDRLRIILTSLKIGGAQ